MKVRFYVDVYPWHASGALANHPIFASTTPPNGPKDPNAQRVAIDVDLPDPIVDKVVQGKVTPA